MQFSEHSIRRGARPFPRSVVSLALALLLTLIAQGESSSFTPPSAETFSGKKAAEDVLRRLEIDSRAARDPLALLDLKMNDLVTHWQWGEAQGTTPPSLELHYENDARAVIAVPNGALLGYLRYGSTWVAPGPPDQYAPKIPQTKDDAIAESDAAVKVEEWIGKFLPVGTWHTIELKYNDRYDATPGDLFGAWWEARAERVHLGYPARSADVRIALNASDGALMQLQLPMFAGPRDVAIYFPVENARIKAEDYLAARSAEALGELILRDPNAPDQFLVDAKPETRAERKRERRLDRALADGDMERVEALQADAPSASPQISATPPILALGEVEIVLAPVSLVYSQAQWKPLSDTHSTPQFVLVYAFPTQTPTAPTGPLYVTTAGNEVVR